MGQSQHFSYGRLLPEPKGVLREVFLLVVALSLVQVAGCGSAGSGSTVSRPGGAADPTTTVDYDFSNFDGIAVTGPFVTSITPGPHSVQVTVDSDVVHLRDVRESGQTLEIGFLPGNNIESQTLDVQITMPSLTSINLTGATFAQAFDFSGSLLEVQLGGVAVFEGIDMTFDLLLADVSAVSVLSMEDSNSLPAADVNVSDVSVATVIIMDSGVLTGSAFGVSSLGYYGSNVTATVTADTTSAVTHLGNTRP